jgi:hypothetical protein
MKTCKTCQVEKSTDDFYLTYHGRPAGECKACAADRKKASRAKRSKEELAAIENRAYLLRTYGLTPEAYADLTKDGCAVCGSTDNLRVDHDHSCCPGKKTCGNCIRGALCNNCNAAEGYLNSNPERVASLLAYVLQHQKETSNV